jgi:large subunit ribosomal protein L9
MKVILRKDVENLGSFGDVVTVKPGFARNYLIPRGMAVAATSGNIVQLESEKEAWRRKAAKLREDAEKLAAELSTVTLSFKRKAGEDGKLFGSVTSMDMEAAFREKGFGVEKKNIQLPEPIRGLGVFPVTVKLHSEVKAQVNVSVEKEEG